MTPRKGETIDYRGHYLKPKGKGSEEDYELNYYGDETFLKSCAFENEKDILQSRISELEWRFKLLVVSGIVLMIISIAAIAFSIVHHLKIEQNIQHLSELQRSQNRMEVRISDELHQSLSVEEFVSEITLVGGDGRTYGNLFVYGSPVCDDLWNNNSATVACRMLGFKKVTVQILVLLKLKSLFKGTATKGSKYGHVPRIMSLDNVNCTGSEESLFKCQHKNEDDCGSVEGAGVICSN